MKFLKEHKKRKIDNNSKCLLDWLNLTNNDKTGISARKTVMATWAVATEPKSAIIATRADVFQYDYHSKLL